MRKIIQIAVVPCNMFGFTINIRMYAFCNDGTVWYSDRLNKKDDGWKKSDINEIPQG